MVVKWWTCLGLPHKKDYNSLSFQLPMANGDWVRLQVFIGIVYNNNSVEPTVLLNVAVQRVANSVINITSVLH